MINISNSITIERISPSNEQFFFGYYDISTENLVLGEIVEFFSGNQICADAVIIKGKVSVNESLLFSNLILIELVVGCCSLL